MSSCQAPSDDPKPGQVSRRLAALGLAFAATAGLAAAVTPRRHERTLGGARLADVVPARAGAYAVADGAPLVLPDEGQPTDVYDQVLARAYVAPGRPLIMLLIAYGAAQSGLMQVHRPEVCYASSGFSVRNDAPVDIAVGSASPIAAKTFLASREDRVEQVLYWTRISDAFPRDLTAQRLVMLERGMSGFIPDGVLVRISTPGADRAAGVAAMAAFARAIVSSADARGRALLIGVAGPVARG